MSSTPQDESTGVVGMGRRTVLRKAAAGLVVAGAMAAVPGASAQAFGAPAGSVGRTAPVRVGTRARAAAVPGNWRLKPFSLDQVQVTTSEFTANRDRLLQLARTYPVDRILANFRRTAGLPVGSAQPPGGWDDATGNLRGHYSGHLLSLIAQAYAGTGEQALKNKVDSLVTGLGECQTAMAASGLYSHPGFLAAYPEEQFVRLEAYATYPSIWAPYYTCHKILAGLLDCHLLGGSQQALDIAAAMGRWVHSRLSQCTEAQLQRMWGLYIAGEYGGMNESLMTLAELTGDELFVTTARYFDNKRLLDACAADEDILNGLHANQHIPQFAGYLGLYDHTRDPKYLDAVENFWGMVVPHRMYAHGGTGQGELFRARDGIAGSINAATNAETCACYNMLKLSRMLFFHDPDPKYMDYYERGLFNQILGSREDRDDANTDNPWVTYMLPVGPGATRGYGNIGTCCGGTGLENHTKYQDSIYFASADDAELYVNLYIGSVLNWTDRGITIEQDSEFPAMGATRLTIRGGGQLALKLRVPQWVRNGFRVEVNGELVVEDGAPGSYVTIARSWSDGDVVDVSMPFSLRTEAALDDPTMQSVFHGPIVLVARNASSSPRRVGLYRNMRLSGEIGKDFVATGQSNTFTNSQVTWAPLYQATRDPYHLYFRRSEPTVTFGSVDTGVANVAAAGRGTFLDEVWEAAPFASRTSFVQRINELSQAFVDEGRMSRRDRQVVVLAAAKAPVQA